jgi:DNA-binding NarL/FixJ family response regulator
MFDNTDFTATEHQLLHALTTGASNKTIAKRLGKSAYTVRNQLSSLFKKISVSNRTQALGWYSEHGAHMSQSGGNGTSVPLHATQLGAENSI